MRRKFTICWTRLVDFHYNDNWLDLYSSKSKPKVLPLEGNGLQYLFAIDNSELKTTLEKMKSHDVKIVSADIEIQDDPETYKVHVQYGKEPTYFLKKFL